MFARRRSSQKPDEDFYAAFKQYFPEVGPGTTSADPGAAIPALSQQRSTSGSEAVVDDPSDANRPFDNVDELSKDHPTSTPKGFGGDQWRLTPSMMDPNSYAFSAFANQPPGYYTPTPGGFNTFYHNSVAGDLHTPGMGMNTPLSLPHSIHALHASDQTLHYPTHFNPHLLHQGHPFNDAFTGQPGPHAQPAYAPPNFLQHQDSGYSAPDDSSRKVTPTGIDVQAPQTTTITSGLPHLDHQLVPANFPSAERFRFHTTLNAPTAMVRQSDEIPMTYLNKGQAYTMSIFDTTPPSAPPGTILKYRTYVRVTFEEETQREKPAACWQLWKEGRGSNEAHVRGGKLRAVEYVDPNQGGDEELRKSPIELEHATFDGFIVNWYPNSRASGAPDCSISVRFNFLSTDFSHSKGVKGIPCRLCAKTELITELPGSSSPQPEVCYSKIKLFRDHGAERKLVNDIAHVKKSIEKLKQQIQQAETGLGNVGKRKRSGSVAKGGSLPNKSNKHNRTWSADSVAETGKVSAEEDLHVKLGAFQDMFSSTRPVSVLFLRGEPEDDPDAFPVKLTGGDEVQVQPLARTQTWESRQSVSDSPVSNVSPTLSTTSLTPKRKFSELQHSVILEEPEDESASEQGRGSTPVRPVKVLKREHDSTRANIVAVDVDSNYQPPSIERPIKPVACFYVRQQGALEPYYRAVYLLRRTVKDLTNKIAEKFSVDASRITQVTHINSTGLRIVVDEDVVRELSEGQAMIVEFAPTKHEGPIKHEFGDPTSAGIICDGTLTTEENIISDPLEMWLTF